MGLGAVLDAMDANSFASAMIGSMSQGWPARWTQMIALVRGVSTARIVSAVIFWLLRSTLANTVAAPAAGTFGFFSPASGSSCAVSHALPTFCPGLYCPVFLKTVVCPILGGHGPKSESGNLIEQFRMTVDQLEQDRRLSIWL